MSNIFLSKDAIKVQDFEDFIIKDFYERFRELFLKKNNTFTFLKEKIVKFPYVFAYFSYLGYTKRDGWIILKKMSKMGLIEFVPFHGIKFKVDFHGK